MTLDRAFEEIAGEAGLALDHPAELMLPVRRQDLAAARQFAAELEMAVAERALALLEGGTKACAGIPRRADAAHTGGP